MRLTIFCDLRITRRKLFHVVQNEAQEIVYRSRLLADCIGFAVAEGATEIMLDLDDVEGINSLGTYLLAKVT